MRCKSSSSLPWFQLLLWINAIGSFTNQKSDSESSSSVQSCVDLLITVTTPWQKHLSLNGRDNFSSLVADDGSDLSFKMQTWPLAPWRNTKQNGWLILIIDLSKWIIATILYIKKDSIANKLGKGKRYPFTENIGKNWK